MAKSGTDQHEGKVSIWESIHHTNTAANLPIELFYDIVGMGAGRNHLKSYFNQHNCNIIPTASIHSSGEQSKGTCLNCLSTL